MRAVYIALLLSGSFSLGAVSLDAIQQAEQELFAARYDRAADPYAKLLHDDPAWAPGYYGAVRALIGACRARSVLHRRGGLAACPRNCRGPDRGRPGCLSQRRLAKSGCLFSQSPEDQCEIRSRFERPGFALQRPFEVQDRANAHNRGLPGFARRPTPDIRLGQYVTGDKHIAALQRALAIYDPASREARGLRVHIAKDKAAGNRKLRRVATPYQSYQIKLVPISPGTGRPYAIGLGAQLNNRHTVQLLLDTGASGISISPKAAEKAGLEILSDESTEAHGIGSQKPPEAFDFLAGDVAIGDLHFADFPVDAFRSAKTTDYDGLIGADVFQRFLVGIDFKEMRLTLDSYPGNPPASNELQDSADDLAPGFFRFFRFGHELTVHTSVNQGPLQLFLIDSGSSANLIDTDTAKESTKVHGDYQTCCAAFKDAPIRFRVPAGYRWSSRDSARTIPICWPPAWRVAATCRALASPAY